MPEHASFSGLYAYKYLPSLAKFILENHLHQFAEEQLALSRKFEVPLLKFLSNFSDPELIEISKVSVAEILEYLVNNDAYQQITNSGQKWMTNQLEIVGKYDVVAEDITLINHVRARSLKNFALKLFSDSKERYELLNEIDDYVLACTTASANIYIKILYHKIQEEEDFRIKLSNALPGYVYVLDTKNNKEIHSNNKLNNILCYSYNEFEEIKKGFYKSITHPEDWQKLIKFRKNCDAQNDAVNTIEIRLKDCAGNYKWIRNYETVLKCDDQEGVEEIIGVAFDVTAEKEITEALAIREAQLLEAQNIGQIGSFEWNIDAQKSTTNSPEIYKIFEMSEMEKFEQFMNHVHREDVKKVEEKLLQAFKTGKYECEYRYIRNGKEKILWSKGIVDIENGAPAKMIGTVQDVTAIKRIEAELKQKTEELQKSNESLQQFAAVASHDLKEPLRKISIFGSMVFKAEQDKISETSLGALKKIIDSTLRLQQMIDDILRFALIERKQEKQEVSLEDLLNEVKDLLSENISDKNAVIYSDGLPNAFVITSQMRQLFQNLVANSLKFSRPNVQPLIHITHSFIIDKPAASQEKKNLQLCFTDNGIGFNEKDNEKIFGLFFRLHHHSTVSGSGLGLSICKKIVEQHGGQITAHSQPGAGATFTILLPA